MNSIFRSLHIFLTVTLLTTALAVPGVARAFSPDTYAAQSALASGRWVKISVPSTGLYAITPATLRQWGFSDIQKVRIHGYGGNRIPDQMTAENYFDDLPEVQSAVTDRGLVFYGVGPEKWSYSGTEWNHSLNPFSTVGYYYVTESDSPRREIPEEGMTASDSRNYATTFTEHLYHELDRVSPATLGLLLVGEDFRFTPSQQFRFSTPGAVGGESNATVRVNFLATSGATSRLELTAGSAPVTPLKGSTIAASGEGTLALCSGSFSLGAESVNIGIRFAGSGTVTMANLDYIELEYLRRIALASGRLQFSTQSSAVEVAASGASDVTVWDVTSPLDIKRMAVTAASGSVRFVNPYSGMRDYAAFSASASLPAPSLVGLVANQNLHATPTPDMVIVATEQNLIQAERIAELHRSGRDQLKVLVVHTSEVYNEFGSGAADPGAIRKMAKMFYDRSKAPAGEDNGNFRYLLLMGRPTYDNRRLTSSLSGSSYETLPAWATDTGLNENMSYCSDDYFAMLEDNSGLRWGSEQLLVAVGRIPSTSNADAKIFTDRLISYVSEPSGEWASRVVMTADDGNESIHLLQSEDMMTNFNATRGGLDLNYKKVYFGAYTLANGIYADAIATFRRQIEDGVLWWNFIGHAAIDNLTSEGLLTTNDTYSLYLRKPLVFYGATCSFGRWDGDRLSGIEALTLRESGGAVAAISAVRPVYISLNGDLSKMLSQTVFTRDDAGRLPTLGEALMNAKNRLSSDTNKRRYVLLGDPAMRLAVPDNRVEVVSVNGTAADSDENPPTLAAMQPTSIKGRLVTPAGEPMTDFNGTLSFTLYDAEYSVISNEVDQFDHQVSFEQQGERLAAGRAKVAAGEFEITFTMPSEIADNYRPGALSLYAVSDGRDREAASTFRNIYLFGTADDVAADDVAPTIEYLHLNHESFADGDAVSDAPMLIARVSDDIGINLSTAGVGHQMTVRIDGNRSFSDVAASFLPDEDGSPAGTIAYRLPTLTEGEHTAELKVWDVSGNSASTSVKFTVDAALSPSIFEIYTDANPATTEANFYVTHNCPDEILNVTIEVFDLNGRLQWSETSTGRADMFSSSPVRWDLTCKSGGRVPRGIYIYRARIAPASRPEAVSASASRRLAVAGF